jgi:hypothetical protein
LRGALAVAASRVAFPPPERQRLSRRVETIEPLRHLVDLAADSLECGLETQAVGRKAIQMVEDADEGVRGRGLGGVDLAADEIERPLEPRNLQQRKVIGWIGVAAVQLLANDLLHSADA